MKCLVAINPNKVDDQSYESLGCVKFGPVDIHLGLVALDEPNFDSEASKNHDFVLVKVKSFSCNYRDKTLLLMNYEQIQSTERLFIPFGSEFSGEVIGIGKNVKEFKVGDQVMPNCAYPDSGCEGVIPGVSTNFASLGWLRLHKNKLIKQPKNFTSEEAACFSLGAQTASGMIKRSGVLEANASPVVFSSRSATSMFIIQNLLLQGIEPICLTTTEWSEEEKRLLAPAQIIKIDRTGPIDSSLKYKHSHVFDPFFDMNIEKGVSCLDLGGTYISCGIRDQHYLLSSETPNDAEPKVRNAVVQSIIKNISIMGNCLGSTQDLEHAIALQEKNKFPPIIDQQYTCYEGNTFVKRTFFDASKFGKCVLSYID